MALVANVQQTGFYRVNYDQRNWEMLAQLLLADHASVHRINRAQVRLDIPKKDDSNCFSRRFSTMHLTWHVLVSWNTQQPWQPPSTSVWKKTTFPGRPRLLGELMARIRSIF